MILVAWLVAIVLVTIAPIGGGVAVWWGFTNHPRLTAIVLVTVVCAVLFAMLSFHHFFPNCRTRLSIRGLPIIECR